MVTLFCSVIQKDPVGSGTFSRIRNYLFLFVPDPERMKEQTNCVLFLILDKLILDYRTLYSTVVWNKKWQIVFYTYFSVWLLLWAVLQIRIYYYADPDPDPGSKKCPFGSGSGCGSGSGSEGVNTKKEKFHTKIFSYIFQNDIKNH